MQRIKHFIDRNAIKIIVISTIALLISIVLPLPLYAEQPGSAKNLSEHVEVAGKKPKIDGSYMITAVGMRRVNLWGAIGAIMDPHQSLMSEDDALGGASMQQDQALNALYMTSSINQAKVNAYREAGLDYKRIFKGIYVLNVQANSNFADVLSVGDTITAVDDKKFNSTHNFQNYIKEKPIDTNIKLTYEHEGTSKDATRKTISLGGKDNQSGIGIILAEDTEIQGTPEIEADLGAIGGPSGGLMLTLEMYDAMTPEDLAKNRQIAGTGTIDPKGNVGEIGGIDKKIIAARDAGAKIFFAPYVQPNAEYKKIMGDTPTNYELAKKTAEKYAPDMTVVPVRTLNEAIVYLRK